MPRFLADILPSRSHHCFFHLSLNRLEYWLDPIGFAGIRRVILKKKSGRGNFARIFSLTQLAAVIQVVPLLNILFHPSGTHANGHLDAVFVFLGPVFDSPSCKSLFTTALVADLLSVHTGRYGIPYPTSETDLNTMPNCCQDFFTHFCVVVTFC